MPTEELPFIYWDACVPMSYINAVADRVPHIQGLMSVSGKDLRLITSVLSIAEVAFAKIEQDGQLLDKEAEERIAKLWEPASPIELAEIHELIMHDAKELMRRAIAHTPEKWSLKPADAIHLATADRLDVKEFHTYDDKLDKFEAITNKHFPIVRPIAQQPVIVIPPMMETKPDSPPSQADDKEKESEKPEAAATTDVESSDIRASDNGGPGNAGTEAKEEEGASEKELKPETIPPKRDGELKAEEQVEAPPAVMPLNTKRAISFEEIPEAPKPTSEGGLGGSGS